MTDPIPGCLTYVQGLAASPAYDEVVVLARGCCGGTEDPPIVCRYEVQAYPRTATGEPMPTRMFALTGPPGSRISALRYIEVDERNDRIPIPVVDDVGEPTLHAYPRTASGSPPPLVSYPIPIRGFSVGPRLRLCD